MKVKTSGGSKDPLPQTEKKKKKKKTSGEDYAEAFEKEYFPKRKKKSHGVSLCLNLYLEQYLELYD